MDADLGGAYAEIEKDITLALKDNRGNRNLHVSVSGMQ
jgi:hypothetical protein